MKGKILILASLFCWHLSLLPAPAQSEIEPLTPADGSAEDLRGLDSDNSNIPSAGVGGADYPDEIEYSPTQTENRGLLQPTSDEQRWRQQNRGDVPNQGGTIPISNF